MQTLGVGDGASTSFQLVKHDASGGEVITRTVAKPVGGTVRVYLDGVEQHSYWSVDVTTSLVTFATAPAAGVIVIADLDVDVPARFDIDQMEITIETFELGSWGQIPVVKPRA